MTNSPFHLLTLLILFLRALSAISRTNWFIVWISIELNLLTFIPLILLSKINQETEGAIKYFLAQVLGSAIMLLSSISIWYPHTSIIKITLILSLILKLGAAPCHFWYPQTIISISWSNCLLLATWQKLAPLIILAYLINPICNIIYPISIINALTGGLIGLNQTNLRRLLAYASITHMAWILGPLRIKCPCLTSTYFIFYCIMTTPIFSILIINHQTTPNQLNKLTPMTLTLLSILLLSCAGIPPITGFFPKWILIQWFIWKSNIIILLFLLIGSYINLYFYLILAFNSLSSPSKPTSELSNPIYIIALSTSALGLLLSLLSYALTLLY